MLRSLWLFCLVLALAGGLASSAQAQTGCPPGQSFVPTLNRCVATGAAPSCPPGTRYSPDERRCLGTPDPVCPQGQSYDMQQLKCVEAAPK